LKTSVLMVGCGNMGGALLSRWVALDDAEFTVTDPGRPALPAGVRAAAEASELKDRRFDVIIAAVKPQLIPKAMPEPAALLKPDGVVISIAAGLSAAQVSAACGGARVIRLMPNMPARVGRGVSGIYAQPECAETHTAFAERLAECAGTAIRLDDEDALDRITAAAGSGPGYVFEFARSYQRAVTAQGFTPDEARRLVLETLLGSLLLAEESGEAFEDLRNAIMSKGGTTQAGVDALNRDGRLDESLDAAVSAAYRRAVELRA